MTDEKKKNGGGMMGMITFLVGLAICCAFFGGTMVIVVAGMVPTFVALITDRAPQKSGAIAISVLNVASTLPFMIALWNQGGDMTDAVRMLSDPLTWLIMYGGAGAGWCIYNYVPKMIATYASVRAQAAIAQRKELQKKLLERWGPRVTSDKPLSALEKE